MTTDRKPCMMAGRETRQGYVECLSDRIVTTTGDVPTDLCDGIGRAPCPYRDKPNREVTGLGDVVHQVTHATGIGNRVGRKCGCRRRRDWLNRLIPFRRRRDKN